MIRKTKNLGHKRPDADLRKTPQYNGFLMLLRTCVARGLENVLS